MVVTAAGEIDIATAAQFATALHNALDSHSGQTVVDLGEVTFLGTVGLATLVEATQNATRRGAPPPIVVAAYPAVLRPIQIAGLDQVLAIRHSIDEALTR